MQTAKSVCFCFCLLTYVEVWMNFELAKRTVRFLQISLRKGQPDITIDVSREPDGSSGYHQCFQNPEWRFLPWEYGGLHYAREMPPEQQSKANVAHKRRSRRVVKDATQVPDGCARLLRSGAHSNAARLRSLHCLFFLDPPSLFPLCSSTN